MSGYVGMGPSALLCSGSVMLLRRPCFYCYYPKKQYLERVYICKMLRQRCCVDISAAKQYKLICEE